MDCMDAISELETLNMLRIWTIFDSSQPDYYAMHGTKPNLFKLTNFHAVFLMVRLVFLLQRNLNNV